MTFAGFSALLTSLSGAVLCLSTASLPSLPTPAVTFTHLPDKHRGINGPETSINHASTARLFWFSPTVPPAPVRKQPRSSRARWETRSIQPILGLPQSLLQLDTPMNTSAGRCSRGILTKCSTSTGDEDFLFIYLFILPTSLSRCPRWSGPVWFGSGPSRCELFCRSTTGLCPGRTAWSAPSRQKCFHQVDPLQRQETNEKRASDVERVPSETQSSPFADLTSEETSSEPFLLWSWSVFCFKVGFWKAFIQSRASPLFSAERWSLNQRTMSVRPRLVWTSSWLYSSGDGH